MAQPPQEKSIHVISINFLFDDDYKAYFLNNPDLV